MKCADSDKGVGVGHPRLDNESCLAAVRAMALCKQQSKFVKMHGHAGDEKAIKASLAVYVEEEAWKYQPTSPAPQPRAYWQSCRGVYRHPGLNIM